MIAKCLNCNRDYEQETQGAICPHEVGGPNISLPWPKRTPLCSQIDPIDLKKHTIHVQEFLQEMYATMIDPVEQPKLTVAEMCELLLNAAREQRERNILSVRSPEGAKPPEKGK